MPKKKTAAKKTAAKTAAAKKPTRKTAAKKTAEKQAVAEAMAAWTAAEQAAALQPAGLEAIRDVDVEVTVELGRTTVTLDQALDMGENSMQELNRRVGEAVDIRLNGKLYARGEVVTVNEYFGVRLTEVIGQGAE